MFGKRKFKEIYERVSELEFENYRLDIMVPMSRPILKKLS